MRKTMEELAVLYQEISAVADSYQTAITERRRNMNKELRNRERRLRYRAKQKGLRIRKDYCWINNEKHIGYLISTYNSSLVLTGYNHFNNLIPIEEAEEFINEY